jgi:glutathione synthase/RimK-type ligase-like ATP-grasp enzyme
LKWVNHPLAISSAIYKPEQLARAASVGLAVPETVITSNPAAAATFCRTHRWDVVAKPIGHGYVANPEESEWYLVYANPLTPDHGRHLDLVKNCPTLFQRRIHKVFDYRVTVVDEECLSVRLRSTLENPQLDCRRSNMEGIRYETCDIPDDVRLKLIRLTQSYGLHFAAADLAEDDAGLWWFFEINPAGQWAWLEEQTGIPISQALVNCLRPARSGQ